MPMHDWTRVPAGIYHDFHGAWVHTIKRSLNASLPPDHYALAEQTAGGYGPDVLTLQLRDSPGSGGPATATRPRAKIVTETDANFYRRKQRAVVVRHVSGDRVVAVIEVVSPGNRNKSSAFAKFLRKTREFFEQHVHMLVIDPFPPDARCPHGIHAAIFGEYQDDPARLPPDKPLSLVAYECGDTLRGYLEPVAVGDALIDMPIFLAPDWFVEVPLEATYNAALAEVPMRWRDVVAPPADA